MSAKVLAVSLSSEHGFSKQPRLCVRLLTDRGVEGDAHCGETVQHLYLKRRSATAPNLMQVHLLPSELLKNLAQEGFEIQPGDLGENITTEGLELESVPLGTRLHLGSEAVVELTGLRTPCKQIEAFRAGLLKRVMTRDCDGRKSAKAGVMSVVVTGGDVFPGDLITVEPPVTPHRVLALL